MVSFWSGFQYGLCEGLNLNVSTCAERYINQDVPIEEAFFMVISNIFGSVPYTPWATDQQQVNYIEQKFGYLLDMVLTIAGIILVPEMIIFIHKHFRL